MNNTSNLTESIIKLNGTAGLVKSENRIYSYFDFNYHDLSDNIDHLIQILESNISRTYLEPQFFYSWEQNEITQNARWIAKNVINLTKILVVIGYSFPRYNKDIDAEIFKDSGIEKVYLQCPENEVSEISKKICMIAEINPDRIIPINNLDTFYVPYEFEN